MDRAYRTLDLPDDPACEMLLIDGQETGAVKDLMRRRTQRLLRGTRGTTALQDAVWDLYERRNGMVHAGRSDHNADIYLARQAYVRLFIEIAERRRTLSPQGRRPMRDLSGV